MRQVDVLCSRVQHIKDADASELSALYKDLIGYDPFEEGESFESVKATLLDYVREECYLAGIHVSEVGL